MARLVSRLIVTRSRPWQAITGRIHHSTFALLFNEMHLAKLLLHSDKKEAEKMAFLGGSASRSKAMCNRQ